MTSIDLHPGPDTALDAMPAADRDMALISVFGPHGIGANPDEAFNLLGIDAPAEVDRYLEQLRRPEGTIAQFREARREAFDAFFAAISVTTVRQLAERLEAPVPLTATVHQVQAYQVRDGCRRVNPQGTGAWCETHGSYYDHEDWTSRGCAHAAREADFAMHVSSRP